MTDPNTKENCMALMLTLAAKPKQVLNVNDVYRELTQELRF